MSNKEVRNEQIFKALEENKGKWLTARELFSFICSKYQGHSTVFNSKSLAFILKGLKLISRRRYSDSSVRSVEPDLPSRNLYRNTHRYETEYYCEKPIEPIEANLT